MLTEIYIEALLVDEDLADLVWEFRIVASGSFHPKRSFKLLEIE